MVSEILGFYEVNGVGHARTSQLGTSWSVLLSASYHKE